MSCQGRKPREGPDLGQGLEQSWGASSVSPKADLGKQVLCGVGPAPASGGGASGPCLTTLPRRGPGDGAARPCCPPTRGRLQRSLLRRDRWEDASQVTLRLGDRALLRRGGPGEHTPVCRASRPCGGQGTEAQRQSAPPGLRVCCQISPGWTGQDSGGWEEPTWGRPQEAPGRSLHHG